ncbi:MAG: outer membrane lipid asymmetry maintenance protein MlaD [Hyphomicrobiales bacterium]
MKQTALETLIGAIVIIAGVGFFTFAYTVSGIGRGEGGYHLIVAFQNAEGIHPGTDIRMSGIKIGTVIAQNLDPKSYQAIVTLAIDKKIQLPEDTSAKITSEGLLGEKFITLEAGGAPVMLRDGDHILYSQGAIDIWTLIGRAIFNKNGGDK